MSLNVDEGTKLLPDSKPLQVRGPLAQGTAWLRELTAEFGFPLIGMLFFSQHVTKGFVKDFTGAAGQYILEAYHVPASHMGVYAGVMSLPWALKPAIGMVSDYFPVNGYSKAPYILFSSIVGSLALFALGWFRTQLPVTAVVFLCFCCQYQFSTVDLLTEAQYARALKGKPESGPNLISFVWGGMTVASIMAIVCSGWMLSHGTPWALYTVGAVPAAFIIIPTLGNWLQEEKQTTEEVEQQRSSIRNQQEACVLCAVMLCSTLTLSWSGMVLSTKANALVSLGVLLVVLGAFSVLLNPIIAKVNAFGLIQTALALGVGGASFYFCMDDEKAFPTGPHFSVQFFSMVLPLVGSVCSIIGIYTYNKYGTEVTYTRMYVMGNLILCIVSLLDVVFYLRINRRWGISDHIFVLGSSSVQTVIGSWLWMPGVIIMSQLCPKGMEAIMYALLAGCHNLGGTISANFGALLLEELVVTPNGSADETAKFDNLWIVAVIGCVLPTLTIGLVPWFIPAKKQTEALLPEGALGGATDGSFWRVHVKGERA